MNAITEKVSLTVNQGNLIRALRDFFTNSNLTYSTEALQNARRAGATEVHIETFESEGRKCFRITDNGCGINDWQKLLTVAESGWQDAVMKSDSPYGIGFMSLLFAAEHCRVASNGKELNFECDKALGMEDILIGSSTVTSGTVVELIGLKKKIDQDRLLYTMHGFPVPVFLNGKEIDRYHAVVNVKLPVGDAHLPPLSDFGDNKDSFKEHFNAVNFALYLQGMLVYCKHTNPVYVSFIVHLDSTRFFGRLPDRTVLIDEVDAVKATSECIRTFYIDELVKTRTVMKNDEAFLNLYASFVSTLCPEMLNEVDVLPSKLLAAPGPYGLIDINHDILSADLRIGHKNVSRAEVEQGAIELYMIESPESTEFDYNLAGWHFLQHRKNAVLVEKSLPDGHWAKEFIVNLDLVLLEGEGNIEDAGNTEIFAYKVINKGKTKHVGGERVYSNITLCDSIELTLKIAGKTDRVVTIDDSSFPVGTSGCGEASDVYVPVKSNGSDACAQLSDYMSEYEYREGEYDDDCNLVTALVAQMRLDDPQAVFEHVLRQEIHSFNNYAELKGLSFVVSIDAEGNYTVGKQ